MTKVISAEDIAKLPYRPCVGVMLVNSAGRVFAAARLDRPKDAPKAWQMPQGGVDKGEAPRAAALRELTEETGIPADAVTVIAETEEWIPYELPSHLVGKLWKGKYRGQEQKWFLLRFHGSDELINIDTEIPEFEEWQWMDKADLVPNIVPFKRDTYMRVLEAFKEHLVCKT
jgi:putative (di)nucleoside polyphosphate hydrolase